MRWLLPIDFGSDGRAVLEAPVCTGDSRGKLSCPMSWYGSRYDYGGHDVYPDGVVYRNHKLLKHNEAVTADFVFAIYRRTDKFVLSLFAH